MSIGDILPMAAATQFQIPMRGNERLLSLIDGRLRLEFQIPMRGNEGDVF